MHQFSEEWKPVVGFEDWYEVSILGRVRRIAKKSSGRPLRPRLNRGGYPYVQLCTSLGKASKLVHVLVAEAFLGPRPEKHDVNHIDSDKANPRADNLEYVTRRENLRHAVRLGRVKPPKFTVRIPDEVRASVRADRKKSLSVIAIKHGISVASAGKFRRKAEKPLAGGCDD